MYVAQEKSEPNTELSADESASSAVAGQEPASDALENAVKDSSPEPGGRRTGMSVALGLVLGGVIAAALGFAAARTIVPEGWPFPGVTPEPDPLVAAIERQGAALKDMQQQVADLTGRLAELEAALQAVQADTRADDLQAALDQTNQRLSDLGDALTALDARLLEVEKLPQGSGTEAADAAAAAYERELSTMREMLAQELARIEAQQQAAQETGASAEAEAQAATLQAAMAELRGALETGAPFADALATLAKADEQSDGGPVPDALRAVADTGIPTQAALQESFPEAARAALAASIDALVAQGKISRVEGFLRRQLGTRSLEPRAGDDPDAVLSRAEAALKSGDLDGALAELDSLPEAGRAEMADWTRQAETRRAALAAADTLAARLNLQ